MCLVSRRSMRWCNVSLVLGHTMTSTVVMVESVPHLWLAGFTSCRVYAGLWLRVYISSLCAFEKWRCVLLIHTSLSLCRRLDEDGAICSVRY